MSDSPMDPEGTESSTTGADAPKPPKKSAGAASSASTEAARVDGTAPPSSGEGARVAGPTAPSSAEAARVSAAAVEAPSPDVALADQATPLPGVHRGGFQRLPTAPVSVTIESAPGEPGTDLEREPVGQWPMLTPAPARRGLANWALAFSIAGLLCSLFVGWGFPIGLVGVVSAILALRRPLENRTVALWALVLGIVSVLYSAGWLVYAAGRANLFG